MKKELLGISLLVALLSGCNSEDKTISEENTTNITKPVEQVKPVVKDYTLDIKTQIIENQNLAEKLGHPEFYTAPVDGNYTKELYESEKEKGYQLLDQLKKNDYKCDSEFVKTKLEDHLKLRGYSKHEFYTGYEIKSLKEDENVGSQCVFIVLHSKPAFDRNYEYSTKIDENKITSVKFNL